ncbi:hypothetical protein ACWJJH_12245 [Endozoicomonadaceae bacterium StTr2]
MLRQAAAVFLLLSTTVIASDDRSGSGAPWPGETPSEISAKYARVDLGEEISQTISIYGAGQLDVDFDLYEDIQPPQKGDGSLRVVHLYAFSTGNTEAAVDSPPVLMKSIEIPPAEIPTRIHVIHDPKLVLRVESRQAQQADG